MKITWNDIKEKYLEFHKMDSFTENMAIDIDFGYWLMQEYASQQKTVSDEDEITFERLPDNSCIITVKGINELGEEYIRQSTIAYPIYCALINRLESNNSQQKPKEVDWDKLYDKFFKLYLHKGIGHKEASIFNWFKSKLTRD